MCFLGTERPLWPGSGNTGGNRAGSAEGQPTERSGSPGGRGEFRKRRQFAGQRAKGLCSETGGVNRASSHTHVPRAEARTSPELREGLGRSLAL